MEEKINIKVTDMIDIAHYHSHTHTHWTLFYCSAHVIFYSIRTRN